MTTCDYCGETFDSDETLLAHLDRDHDRSELGRIDRRRVEQRAADDGMGVPFGMIVMAGTLALAVGVIGYVAIVGSGGGSTQQAVTQDTHYHGTIEVSIMGEQVDFSREKYQLQDQRFHFERGNGDRWHVHGDGVTLRYAMQTLGIGVTNSTVSFDGTTYRNGDPDTTVIVRVNGSPVSPADYTIKKGDHVRIVVRRG